MAVRVERLGLEQVERRMHRARTSWSSNVPSSSAHAMMASNSVFVAWASAIPTLTAASFSQALVFAFSPCPATTRPLTRSRGTNRDEVEGGRSDSHPSATRGEAAATQKGKSRVCRGRTAEVEKIAVPVLAVARVVTAVVIPALTPTPVTAEPTIPRTQEIASFSRVPRNSLDRSGRGLQSVHQELLALRDLLFVAPQKTDLFALRPAGSACAWRVPRAFSDSLVTSS